MRCGKCSMAMSQHEFCAGEDFLAGTRFIDEGTFDVLPEQGCGLVDHEAAFDDFDGALGVGHTQLAFGVLGGVL